MLITKTKDNNYTVNINGISLHSKYSPIKEAEKFVQSNIHRDGTIIIIGAGLGYIYTVVEDLFPKSSIIGLPLDRELGRQSLKLNKTRRKQWDFINLSSFLNREIDITTIKGLQIITWEPTTKAFNENYLNITNTLAAIIRRLNGNILTTARFGRLWIKNSLKNFLNTENYISDFIISKPIVITASGKSLNDNLDLIKEIRDNIVLISLSSSNMALEQNGITPDITFSTDPGYYSKLHLYGNRKIVGMPLTNSTSDKNTILLLNQGNSFENEIIKMGNLPSISIGENGTVAGTALEFSLTYSYSKIFLIGQDLESSDLRSHVTPYSFDNLLKSEEHRTEPYYSIMYKRWKNQGVSFKTYRDWFTEIALKNPGRIFRLRSYSKEIPGIEDIDRKNFKYWILNNPSKGFSYTVTHYSNKKERKILIEKMLNRWLKTLTEDEIEENPLIYLISTSHYTDIKSKALSDDCRIKIIQSCREESILFIKRLLSIYGRKLL